MDIALGEFRLVPSFFIPNDGGEITALAESDPPIVDGIKTIFKMPSLNNRQMKPFVAWRAGPRGWKFKHFPEMPALNPGDRLTIIWDGD